jgi:PIN domain nuclease of toxin-antitoxin system
MKFILDTHILLWFLTDDPNLSSNSKELIEDPRNHKYVSIASCWEIAIKVSRKKLLLTEPSTVFLEMELSKNHMQLLNIDLRHIALVETLPFHHKDPFDRLIVSQSIVECLPIISVDQTFDVYGVVRIG